MTSLRDRIFVAFDTETTGLSVNDSHVIEIAGVRFTGDGTEIARFSTLANPGVAISPEVTQIHGINDHMVARAPGSVEACRQFADWIDDDDLLIAHNAEFDVKFISNELGHRGIPRPRNTVCDSRLMTKWLRPELPSYRLDSLVDVFKLPRSGHHRALEDSLHVKGLMLSFLEAKPEMSSREYRDISMVDGFYATSAARLNGRPSYSQLTEAIERGAVLSLRYDDADDGFVMARILPLNLCHKAGADHLVAQCMNDGRVREYRLERVIELSQPEFGSAPARRII